MEGVGEELVVVTRGGLGGREANAGGVSRVQAGAELQVADGEYVGPGDDSECTHRHCAKGVATDWVMTIQ